MIAAAKAQRALPTPAEGAKEAWSYICYWIDQSTGERVGRGVRHVIELDPGASYQAVSAEARRRTLYPADVTQSPPIPTEPNLVLRCRRVGGVKTIPTS